MPYNLELEERIGSLSDRLGEISRKNMFGGICYLIGGNMCFGVYRDSLIVRTTKEKADELMECDHISPFDITGRPMKGWVMVSLDGLETEEQLLKMLELGRDFADALPGK